jgi:hypothetical protein
MATRLTAAVLLNACATQWVVRLDTGQPDWRTWTEGAP